MLTVKQKISRIKSLFFAGLFLVGLACIGSIATAFWAIQPSPAIARSHTVSANNSIGISLEGLPYPHPVQFLSLTIEGQPVCMGYMDIRADTNANGRTILLLHGRNFSGNYWQPTIQALTTAGYRAIVPDQVGFGKSSKPDVGVTMGNFSKLGRFAVKAISHSTLVELSGIGHMPHHEAPDQFNQELLRFLSK